MRTPQQTLATLSDLLPTYDIVHVQQETKDAYLVHAYACMICIRGKFREGKLLKFMAIELPNTWRLYQFGEINGLIEVEKVSGAIL